MHAVVESFLIRVCWYIAEIDREWTGGLVILNIRGGLVVLVIRGEW